MRYLLYFTGHSMDNNKMVILCQLIFSLIIARYSASSRLQPAGLLTP